MELLKVKFVNGPDGCMMRFQSDRLEEFFRRISADTHVAFYFNATEIQAIGGDARREREDRYRVKCWDIRNYVSQAGMTYDQGQETLVNFEGAPNIIPFTMCGLKDGITIKRGNIAPPILKSYTHAIGKFLKTLSEQARACEIQLTVVKKVTDA